MTLFQKSGMVILSVLLRFVFILFCLVSAGASGQDSGLRFEHLSSDDGLSQISVECILQDQLGFMWFGTADGLNRYDGHQFKVFRHDQNNPNSLSANDVLSLAEDRAGNLWIGTSSGGLNRYNPKMDMFRVWRHDRDVEGSLAGDRVDSLVMDDAGVLWVGTSGGLSRLDPEAASFVNYVYNPEDPKGLAVRHVRVVFKDLSGALWVGGMNGPLQRLEPDGAFSSFDPHPDTPSSDKGVRAIYETRDGRLWVGTRHGISLFDRDTEAFTQFKSDFLGPGSLSNPWVECIYEDAAGQIWVGTGNGLNRIRPGADGFEVYTHDPASPNSLSHNAVAHLYEDRTGILWIATTGGGLNKYHPRREAFNLVERSTQTQLSMNSIWSFLRDADDNLWVGTWGGGLNMRPKDGQRFVHFKRDADNPRSLSHNDVRCLFEDSAGVIWAGTTGKLNRYDPNDGGFTHFGETEGFTSNIIYWIEEDDSNMLWVGTGWGLNAFNPQTGDVKPYLHLEDDAGSLSHNRVRMVLEDSGGALWVATNGGLNLLDRETDRFSHYRHDPDNPQSLSHDEVRSIMEDSQGRFWVGASHGLNLLHLEQGVFERFHQTDGLPNDVIYGLLEDKDGFLWISTNKGLSRMDPENKVFVNFDFQDGLQDNEFNQGAAYKDRDDVLYFGGNKGYNAFFSDCILPNPAPFKVVITDFSLFNKPTPLQREDPDSPLVFTMPYSSNIELQHDDRVFSFEFAAVHYMSSEKVLYAFRLRGFDQDWNYSDGARRYVTYTHMDHGNYIFEVRAKNKEGVWSQEVARVNLRIHPPWWKTWWFYSILVLSILLVIRHFVLAHGRKLEDERALNERINRQLERNVAERTRELKVKNKALDARNRELETLDRIVETINREMTMENVVQAILDQGLVLVPQAEKAIFLLRDPATDHYGCIAHAGDADIDPEELVFTCEDLLDLFGSKMAYLEEGIYAASNLVEQLGPRFRHRPAPESMATLSIDFEDEIVGLLALGSYSNPLAFEEVDRKILSRLREHAVSAVTKARVLGNLVRAQQDLVDAAHYAGMAEVAVNVLHDMGNTLNSVRTSIHVLDELHRNRPLHRLLGKVVELMENGAGEGVVRDSEKSGRLLREIHRRWELQHERAQNEVSRIGGHIQSMVTTLQEQQTYSRMGNTLEALDLNRLVSESLALEQPILSKSHIEVSFEKQALPKVMVNRSRLMRSIGFIMKNACESLLEKQGGEQRIDLRTDLSENQISLEICDTGVGIASEHLTSVFNNGFTTKPDYRGYGLHYCANALKEMKGRIKIHSDGPGLGACVRLSFPLEKRES